MRLLRTPVLFQGTAIQVVQETTLLQKPSPSSLFCCKDDWLLGLIRPTRGMVESFADTRCRNSEPASTFHSTLLWPAVSRLPTASRRPQSGSALSSGFPLPASHPLSRESVVCLRPPVHPAPIPPSPVFIGSATFRVSRPFVPSRSSTPGTLRFAFATSRRLAKTPARTCLSSCRSAFRRQISPRPNDPGYNGYW